MTRDKKVPAGLTCGPPRRTWQTWEIAVSRRQGDHSDFGALKKLSRKAAPAKALRASSPERNPETKVRRALAVVRAVECYPDTAIFFLSRALTDNEKAKLRAVGIDTSGKGRRYRRPKHTAHGKRLLCIQQPSPKQLAALDKVGLPLHVTWFDPASDLLCEHPRDVIALHHLLARHWLQPDHRGKRANAFFWSGGQRRPEHFAEPSFYFDRNMTAARNAIVYPRRWGKRSDLPALHCEPRMRTKAACAAWHIHDARDAMQADCVAIARRELVLGFVSDPAAFEKRALKHCEAAARRTLGCLVEKDRRRNRRYSMQYPPRSLADLKLHHLKLVLHDATHHSIVRRFDLGPLRHVHEIPCILLQEIFGREVIRHLRRIALLDLLPGVPIGVVK